MKKILTLAMNSALAAALILPTFAQTPAAPAGTTAKATKAAKSAVTPAPTAQDIADAQSKGLVWVNLSTKVYHTSGAFYGKTKHGKFMTKDEADKAGYKAAKEPVAKKSAAKSAPATQK